MSKIYSYVLRYDDGAAPNPFWGFCTLTICKPVIRRTASVGDWVIGTGSAHAYNNSGGRPNMAGQLVYAMKISQKLTLAEYDAFCKENLPDKMPNASAKDWRYRMGDCIYDFSSGMSPQIRGGVHNENNRTRDLGGINALISDHFYYFGEEACPLPLDLLQIVKENQGHKKITNPDLVHKFEHWIAQFERNKLYGEPQMRFAFDKVLDEVLISACSKNHLEADEEEEAFEEIC